MVDPFFQFNLKAHLILLKCVKFYHHLFPRLLSLFLPQVFGKGKTNLISWRSFSFFRIFQTFSPFLFGSFDGVLVERRFFLIELHMRIRLGVDVVVYFVSPISGASKFVSQLSSSYWTLVNIHQLDFISSLPFWMKPEEILIPIFRRWTGGVGEKLLVLHL